MMGNAFNQLISNLARMVIKIKSSSDSVVFRSRELAALSQEMNASNREVSGVMARIAKDAIVQDMQVKETVKLMGMMAASAKDVSRDSESAVAASEQAVQNARSGLQATQDAIMKMKKIAEQVTRSSEVALGLGEKSKQISEVSSVITAIAEQTNLLALNAAIEAARAGEAGRGFAVVADEVRKLAEDSAKSASKIAKLILDVQQESEKAAMSMVVGTQEVNEGLEVVKKLGQSLQAIADVIVSAADKVNQIAAAAAAQFQATGQVNKAIAEIKQITEDNRTAAEQVTGSVATQANAMQNMVESAQNLNTISEELQTLVSEFKIE
jgi:methyl-accepting chemotaxis protein